MHTNDDEELIKEARKCEKGHAITFYQILYVFSFLRKEKLNIQIKDIETIGLYADKGYRAEGLVNAVGRYLRYQESKENTKVDEFIEILNSNKYYDNQNDQTIFYYDNKTLAIYPHEAMAYNNNGHVLFAKVKKLEVPMKIL